MAWTNAQISDEIKALKRQVRNLQESQAALAWELCMEALDAEVGDTPEEGS